jgi:hypothetical protein
VAVGVLAIILGLAVAAMLRKPKPTQPPAGESLAKPAVVHPADESAIVPPLAIANAAATAPAGDAPRGAEQASSASAPARRADATTLAQTNESSVLPPPAVPSVPEDPPVPNAEIAGDAASPEDGDTTPQLDFPSSENQPAHSAETTPVETPPPGEFDHRSLIRRLPPVTPQESTIIAPTIGAAYPGTQRAGMPGVARLDRRIENPYTDPNHEPPRPGLY